jgi:hypothetical protein
MRVHGNYEHRLSARRAQCGKRELRLVASVTGKRKFHGTNAFCMQTLRIVETQKSTRETAIGCELRGNGGHMPAGPLNSAGRIHVCEQSHN